MAVKKCVCSKEYEDEGFKTMCPSCFAKSMNGSKKNESKDSDIRKLVFLKVASNQLQNTTAEEVVNYAKQLEKVYSNWSRL